jgi:hypothetical protein
VRLLGFRVGEPPARWLAGVPRGDLRQLVRTRAGGNPFPRPDSLIALVPVLGEAS